MPNFWARSKHVAFSSGSTEIPSSTPNPKRNPNPSPNHDHNLDWANEKVEQRFKQLCTSPFHEDGRGKIVCFDGTGTHVERQKRRMYARSTARARTNTHMSAFT